MDNKAPWTRGEKTWEVSFLSAYPLLMFTGIIISFLTVLYFWRKQKYSMEILQILLIITVPSSIIGARLWYMISENNWSHPFELKGLSIQGGVMMAVICGGSFIWSKRHVVDFRTAFGIVIPSVLIGQVIGRWGNFNNHEVYGAVISGDNLNWLGSWIKGHMLIDGYYRQPFFLYESTLNFFAYILLIWVLLRKNWVKPGTTGALYFIWYGIVRLIMEPLRDPADIMKPVGNFQMSTFVAILWILFGILLTFYFEVLTNPSKFIKEKFSWLPFSSKEYELIKPIKPRRLFWVGNMSKEKKKYIFWGETMPNKVNIWIPKKDRKWSKKEINAGKKNR